mgnify:FL=1
MQSITLDTLNKSEQEKLSKALANITKIENEIMKDLGIVSIYKQIETDKQINDIDIQKERLEIEKLKQGTEEDKKVEIKIIGVD